MPITARDWFRAAYRRARRAARETPGFGCDRYGRRCPKNILADTYQLLPQAPGLLAEAVAYAMIHRWGDHDEVEAIRRRMVGYRLGFRP